MFSHYIYIYHDGYAYIIATMESAVFAHFQSLSIESIRQYVYTSVGTVQQVIFEPKHFKQVPHVSTSILVV